MNSPIGQENFRPAKRAVDDRRDTATRKRSWFRRNLLFLAGGGAILSIGGVIVALSGHDDLPPPRQIREISIVNILPPPPPPPPPPPEQRMIEQAQIDQPEFQEQKPLDEPKNEPIKDAKNDEPPGPLSLDAKAEGPGDHFNVGANPGGSPYGGGGGGGSGWGWYASMVQAQLHSALEAHKRTRKATMRGNIRLWADQSGRVIKVQLNGSTGDVELDGVLRNEVFSNLTLREPPPKGMPMPMIIRITEQRPS